MSSSVSWIKTTVCAGLLFAGFALPSYAASCAGQIIGTSAGLAACDVALPGATLTPGVDLAASPAQPTQGVRIGSFSDIYNFNLAFAFNVTGNASATNSNGTINPFTIQIWDGLNGGGALLASASGTTNIVTATILLTPGDYSIRIFGTAPADPGASYGGSLNLAPIPLPGALVLFGSGLLGLVALGRKRKQNAALSASA